MCAEEGVGAGDELPRLPRRGDKGGAVGSVIPIQSGAALKRGRGREEDSASNRTITLRMTKAINHQSFIL